MPKITFTSGFKGLSGALDGVVYRNVGGNTYMTRRPERAKRKPSPAQLAQQERFTAAGEYARKVMGDPCQRCVYEALGREYNRRPDKLLASDFLTPPVVERIDLTGCRGKAGGLIRVLATDDVEVVSVNVAVRSAAGVKLEEGPATKVQGVWRYGTMQAWPAGETVIITATARDRPGHDGSAQVAYP